MPKSAKTPASVLQAHMDEYQLTAFSLSKEISISNSSILQILNGKGKITIATALRFAKFFGNPVAFWLDVQRDTDLAAAKEDAELAKVLDTIKRVKVPKAPAEKKKGKDAPPAKKAKAAGGSRKKSEKAEE